jgi:hypothetical protein
MALVDNDALVRDRAYGLWEKAGRPNGREHEHWAEARRQIEDETVSLETPQLIRLVDAPDEKPDETERLRSALYTPEPFSFELFGSECPVVDQPIVIRPPLPRTSFGRAPAQNKPVAA